MTSCSRVIGRKTFTNKISDVYARSQMDFGSVTVLSESPNFMDFGLSSVNTTDEIRSVFVPATRIGRPMDRSTGSHLAILLAKLQQI